MPKNAFAGCSTHMQSFKHAGNFWRALDAINDKAHVKLADELPISESSSKGTNISLQISIELSHLSIFLSINIWLMILTFVSICKIFVRHTKMNKQMKDIK